MFLDMVLFIFKASISGSVLLTLYHSNLLFYLTPTLLRTLYIGPNLIVQDNFLVSGSVD